jgi:hypothetical protein
LILIVFVFLLSQHIKIQLKNIRKKNRMDRIDLLN